MTAPRDLLATIVAEHDPFGDTDPRECWCGHRFDPAAVDDNEDVWALHLADVLIAAGVTIPAGRRRG